MRRCPNCRRRVDAENTVCDFCDEPLDRGQSTPKTSQPQRGQQQPDEGRAPRTVGSESRGQANSQNKRNPGPEKKTNSGQYTRQRTAGSSGHEAVDRGKQRSQSSSPQRSVSKRPQNAGGTADQQTGPHFLFEDEAIISSMTVSPFPSIIRKSYNYYITNNRIIKNVSGGISTSQLTDVQLDEITRITEESPTKLRLWIERVGHIVIILLLLGPAILIQDQIITILSSIMAGLVTLHLISTFFIQLRHFKIDTSNPDVSMEIYVNGNPSAEQNEFIKNVRENARNK
jgi:hypothetical protein